MYCVLLPLCTWRMFGPQCILQHVSHRDVGCAAVSGACSWPSSSGPATQPPSGAVENFGGISKGTLASQGERGKGVIANVAVVLRELLIEGKHNHIRPHVEITMPTTAAELLEVMTGFYNLAGIPGCIGAVDGTLIEIPSIPSAQLEVRNGIGECRRAWYLYK